ncbi:MAG: 2-isopropylmalate synthase, partial [Pseudomonadota bacterium]
RSMGEGADAAAVAIVEVAMDGVAGSCFGAGMHRNTVTASVQAIVSAANRIRVRCGEAAAPREAAGCVV